MAGELSFAAKGSVPQLKGLGLRFMAAPQFSRRISKIGPPARVFPQ
jgi:hypothetical protein